MCKLRVFLSPKPTGVCTVLVKWGSRQREVSLTQDLTNTVALCVGGWLIDDCQQLPQSKTKCTKKKKTIHRYSHSHTDALQKNHTRKTHSAGCFSLTSCRVIPEPVAVHFSSFLAVCFRKPKAATEKCLKAFFFFFKETISLYHKTSQMN